VVAAEIEPALEAIQAIYREVVSLGAEILPISAEAEALARAYLEHGIVPERFVADALHIAVATVGGVDLLVSWNFKHIVRFDRIRMFNAANRESGYKEIEIYSPREVTSHEEG
jgi:hypothetical protein